MAARKPRVLRPTWRGPVIVIGADGRKLDAESWSAGYAACEQDVVAWLRSENEPDISHPAVDDGKPFQSLRARYAGLLLREIEQGAHRERGK